MLKQEIFKTTRDRWRFLETLRYKNHDDNIHRWQKLVREIADGHTMPWPEDEWGKQEPLVRIVGYTLMDNHYHLILEELQENGIPAFMQKLGNSYTGYFKNKHDRDEPVFSRSYKSKRVLSDNQLRKLFVYVLVKNPFERDEDGLMPAIDSFDEGFRQVRKYRFSSLAEVMKDREAYIADPKLFNSLFSSPETFRNFAKEQMSRYGAFRQEIEGISLE